MPRAKVCEICFAVVNASNYSRHLRRVHKLPAPTLRGRSLSAELTMNSRLRAQSLDRASELTAAESTMSVNRPRSALSCLSDDEPPCESTITRVVNHLLEQHHMYNEEDLCEYISTNFPEIPESYPSTIVFTAHCKC